MKPIWGTVAIGAAAAVIAMSGLAPALADVKTGVDAWQQGDYGRAIAEWRPLAQAGDPDAQFNLAQAYKLGRGVQPDLAMAMDLYGRAAAQGHLRAEDNLGLLKFQQGDRANALPYLQRSAARGEPRALYIVGTALFNGDLLGKDWVRAYAMMTRASTAGLPQAATSLEQMDKYIPEDQRKQGLALASTMTQSGGTPALAASQPLPTTRPSPSAVRTTQLPASTIYPVTPTPTPAPAKPLPAKPAPQVALAAPKAKPAPTPAGGWRVQLGAFGEEARARALWSTLTGKVGGLSAYQPYLVKAGTVTRLQAGPLASSNDANRLCGAIRAAGSDCMPKKM